MSTRPSRLVPPDSARTHHVAKLLVSVRSAAEAQAALAGGADVIDVKEPRHGPLGRAGFDVWRDVRRVVPSSVPVSVALGELIEWSADRSIEVPRALWTSLSYCKLGLADAPDDWREAWRELRRRLTGSEPTAPSWVAVVYIDWQAARAPAPEAIIDAAGEIDACKGVLFDSLDKKGRSRISHAWKPLVDRVRDTGRFVALAGSLDATAIERLTPLAPEIFAVRGAACAGGNRLALVDAQRVSRLARAVAFEAG